MNEAADTRSPDIAEDDEEEVLRENESVETSPLDDEEVDEAME